MRMIWKTDASIFLSGTTEALGLKNTEGIMKKAEDGAKSVNSPEPVFLLLKRQKHPQSTLSHGCLLHRGDSGFSRNSSGSTIPTASAWLFSNSLQSESYCFPRIPPLTLPDSIDPKLGTQLSGSWGESGVASQIRYNNRLLSCSSKSSKPVLECKTE